MIGFIGIALAAVSAIAGVKSAKEQKKAARAGNAAVRAQNMRERQNFLKSFRQARAQALVQGVASGARLESSGSKGVQSSLVSQLVDTEDFITEQMDLGAEQASRLENANKFSTISSLFSTGASLASAVKPLTTQNQNTSTAQTNSSPFGPGGMPLPGNIDPRNRAS